MPRLSRPLSVLLVAGALGGIAGGCGGGASAPAATASTPAFDTSTQVSSATCSSATVTVLSGGSTSSSEPASCVFVLSDGQRFRCPASFGRSTPSVSTLEHAKACIRLSRLKLPAAIRAVIATIDAAHECLVAQHLRVTGGPVLPPQGPGSPNGELIVGDGHDGAFIAFYTNPSRAKQLEPEIIQNARHLGGHVERHGAVTVLRIRPPTSQIRGSLHACGL